MNVTHIIISDLVCVKSLTISGERFLFLLSVSFKSFSFSLQNSDSEADIQLFEILTFPHLSASISMHHSHVIVVKLCALLSLTLVFSRQCANRLHRHHLTYCIATYCGRGWHRHRMYCTVCGARPRRWGQSGRVQNGGQPAGSNKLQSMSTQANAGVVKNRLVNNAADRTSRVALESGTDV